jgi:hypothetical protein
MRGQVKTAVAFELLEKDVNDVDDFPRASTIRFNRKETEAPSLSAELKFSEKLFKLQRGQLTPFEVST